jgi:hypothetical protein
VNGENIHTNTIQLSPQKAVDAWMANASETTISLKIDADNQSITMGYSKVRIVHSEMGMVTNI